MFSFLKSVVEEEKKKKIGLALHLFESQKTEEEESRKLVAGLLLPN